MPESAQEWYARVQAGLARDGHRPAYWQDWDTWPFADRLETVRDLERPGDEPPRNGVDAEDCFICAADREDDRDYLAWRDEHWMLGTPREPVALPLVAFLMPRRHADLADLDPESAARMGPAMVAVEQAATDVLDVPRIQVLRIGDGSAHLHWWLIARPTGMTQLRGSFLPLWDDVLPTRPREELRADLRLVAHRLVELVGGEAL